MGVTVFYVTRIAHQVVRKISETKLKMRDMPLIPIWLDWSGKIVLVIGLGQTGQRRSILFQQSGATVIGIDPLPKINGPAWGELIRGGLELRSEPYSVDLFDELESMAMRPDLVLACATETINSRVIQDARARGFWVASVTTGSSPSPNAHLGGVVKGETTSFAIHSGNASPALTVCLKGIVESDLLPAADRMAKLAATLRPLIMKHLSDPEQRRSLLETLGDRDIFDLEAKTPGAGMEKWEKVVRAALES
ncbi:MAG: Precorrin-2 dehydrogenase [Planctomycetota bacterium]